MRKPNYRGWIFTNKAAIYTHFGEALYGSTIGLAEAPLRYAIENNLILIVKTKFGTATYNNPKDWIKNAKKGKKYCKNPNEPIIFYFKDILPDIKKREERKKAEKKIEVSGGLWAYLENLKEKKPEEFKRLKQQILNTP